MIGERIKKQASPILAKHSCGCSGKCSSCRGKAKPQVASMMRSVSSQVSHDIGVLRVLPLRAGLSSEPESDEELTAQADAGVPGGGGSSGPSCFYTVTYANQREAACDAGKCGRGIIYDITNVTATGSGCPATLNGLRVTEVVTNNHGCLSVNVQGGAGCPIGAGGAVSGCTDTYRMCSAETSYPIGGCTEVVTQQIYVGGVLAETHTIDFAISRPSAGNCSGTVTRH